MITFDDALEDSNGLVRNLLLGNGFSISCFSNIFNYQALIDQADFSKHPEVKATFTALNTTDFEKVIHALENTARISALYRIDNQITSKLVNDAAYIKATLINTLANNHPAYPGEISDERFWICRKFLRNFRSSTNDGRIYTLNYDLLLYWALMHGDDPSLEDQYELLPYDGFGEDIDADEPDYVIWKGDEYTGPDQKFFYLHGALHLFDNGLDLKKFTWNRNGQRLIDQARHALTQNAYPLFVSEGDSLKKMEKIKHSAYLYHAYKSFRAITNNANKAIFIYGHSFAENDHHILKLLGKGKYQKLYVSLYGDEDSPTNVAIKRKAQLYATQRLKKPLDVKFYDASSVRIWD